MEKPRIIAGIGSRKAPPAVLERIRELGALCKELGIWVRSGHAPGCDVAWEQGAQELTLIYLPYPNYNPVDPLLTPHVVAIPGGARHAGGHRAPHPQALRRARKSLELHPSKRLSKQAQSYHLRNYMQAMGSGEKEEPVDLVVCWAPVDEAGQVLGGTGQAVRIARHMHVPVINLADEGSADEAARVIGLRVSDR